MDISNSECIRNKDKQNIEMFKFFEKTRKRKTSRTSLKSNKKAKPTTFSLPMRRTTRLKSEIFVENYPEVLPDGEFDISKDFCSTMLKYEPVKKKIKLSNVNLEMKNEQCDEMSETLNGTNSLIDSTLESDDLVYPDKPKKRGRKQKGSQFEKMADDMIETIDTNIIIEMLKNTSLDKEEAEAVPEMLNTSERNITENYDTHFNNTLDGSDPQNDLTNNDNDCTDYDIFFKQSKKRGRKSNSEKIKQSNLDDKPEDNKAGYQTKCDDLKKAAKTSELPKKRGRKPKSLNGEELNQSNVEDKPEDQQREYQTKQTHDSDLANILNDNDSQIPLTTNGDNDLKKAAKTSELPKKRGRKPKSLNVEKLNQSNVEDKPEDQQAEYQTKQTHDTDLGNILHDNDSQISLTTNGDNDLKKAAKTSELPKKRGRKPKSLNNTLLADTSGKKTGILKYFKSNTPAKKINTSATENSDSLLDNDSVNNDSIEISANISEQRSQKSNTMNITDTSLTKSKLNISANTEPKKRGRPKYDKPRVVKVNVAREFQKKPFTKISKLTKDQIKKGSIRKIPKKRLDDVLEMIDDEDHPIWQERNISCNTSIYDHWEPRSVSISYQNMKLKYARQFLLRRDWIGLSKVLYLSNTEATTYYPLLSKYATILLAHTDKEQFNKCIQFLTNMNDSSAVMKKCTKISKENED